MGTGETKLVAGEEKCSSGEIWYCSGCRGVEKLSGETQKCHRVGFTGFVTKSEFLIADMLFLNSVLIGVFSEGIYTHR